MTFYEAAIEVLRISGRPLHYKKITELAIREGLLSHVGKTPEVTMSARLNQEVKKEEHSSIERDRPGVFKLRDEVLERLQAEAAAREAEQAEDEDELEDELEDHDEEQADDNDDAEDSTEEAPAGSRRRRRGRRRGGRRRGGRGRSDSNDSDDSEEVAEAEKEVEKEDEKVAETESPRSSRRSRGRRRGGRRRGGRGRSRSSDDSNDSPSNDEKAAEKAPAKTEERSRRSRRPSRRAPEKADRPEKSSEKSEGSSRGRSRGGRGRGGRSATKHLDQGPVKLDSFAQAAYTVLSDGGDSMDIKDLADTIFDRKLVRFHTHDAAMTIQAAMVNDNQRRKQRGHRKLFVNMSRGRWGLSDWGLSKDMLRLERDILSASEEMRQAAIAQLGKALLDVNADALEHVALTLLEGMGYRDVKVSKRGSDNDVFFSADWRQGLADVRVCIQLVGDSSVELGADAVTDLRGTLHHYSAAEGVIIHLGDIAKTAISESREDKLASVTLIDRSSFVELLVDQGIGVRRFHTPVVLIDTEYLDQLKGAK